MGLKFYPWCLDLKSSIAEVTDDEPNLSNLNKSWERKDSVGLQIMDKTVQEVVLYLLPFESTFSPWKTTPESRQL